MMPANRAVPSAGVSLVVSSKVLVSVERVLAQLRELHLLEYVVTIIVATEEHIC